mgnify:CR=1 FL=1
MGPAVLEEGANVSDPTVAAISDRLSYRQHRLLVSIASYWREFGFSPSLRDLVVRTGISSTSVADYNLRLLERKGLLTQWRGVPRSIVLSARGWELSGITRPCCRPFDEGNTYHWRGWECRR